MNHRPQRSYSQVPPSLSRLPSRNPQSQTSLQTPGAINNGYINPGRLLMPAVRLSSQYPTFAAVPAPPQSLSVPPRSPRLRPTPAKLMRSRSHSHSYSLAGDNASQQHLAYPVKLRTSADTGTEWIGLPLRFEVVEETLEIEGYQMYAVEKWYVVVTSRPECPLHSCAVGLLNEIDQLPRSQFTQVILPIRYGFGS
jgi:hypothetical protein